MKCYINLMVFLFSLISYISVNAEDEINCIKNPEIGISNTECSCDSSVNEWVHMHGGDNRYICLPKCQEGLDRVGTACIQRCYNGQARNKQGVCVSKRDLQEKSTEKCLPHQIENEEGRCINKCISGQERDESGKCVIACNSNTYERFKNKCVRKCNRFQKRNSFGQCVSSDFKVKCRFDQDELEGMCLKKCSPSQERVGKECLTKCNPGQERFKKMCKNTCAPNFKRNEYGLCVFCKS